MNRGGLIERLNKTNALIASLENQIKALELQERKQRAAGDDEGVLASVTAIKQLVGYLENAKAEYHKWNDLWPQVERAEAKASYGQACQDLQLIAANPPTAIVAEALDALRLAIDKVAEARDVVDMEKSLVWSLRSIANKAIASPPTHSPQEFPCALFAEEIARLRSYTRGDPPARANGWAETVLQRRKAQLQPAEVQKAAAGM